MPSHDGGDGASEEVTENDRPHASVHDNSTRTHTFGSRSQDAPVGAASTCLKVHGPRDDSIGVLLVGHGSRRGKANAEFERLVAEFGRKSRYVTKFGYIELATPTLESALDDLAAEVSTVVLVPVFFFLAGHVKNDLPLAVSRARKSHPLVKFCIAPPLGVDNQLCELVWSRVESGLTSPLLEGGPKGRTESACLLVGRGSSDPDANAEFFKVARTMSEQRSLVRVEPCFLGITQPDVSAGLELLSRLRPKRIVVAPYLLFKGRLLERLKATVAEFAASHPWLSISVSDALNADPALLEVLGRRARQALAGEATLPCDTCQYRAPIPGRASEAGGMRALLWSMRHTFTHSQAMPAEHAHAPLKKHVFVCTNADCADRGSVSLLRNLRTEVKAAGLAKSVRVTRTACMGRCGEGPSVAVYPDGIWYRNVTADDAPEMVSEHFASDRIIARLVDNILQ